MMPSCAPDVLTAITETARHSFAKYNLAPAPSGYTGASIGKATLNLGPRRHGVACFWCRLIYVINGQGMSSDGRATTMKAIALAVIFVVGTVASSYAQSTTRYYSKSGSYSGRSVSSGNTVRYYNKSGSYTGRSTTSGSTTRYYNKSGSYVGRSSR
jgi:hypothetical protein